MSNEPKGNTTFETDVDLAFIVGGHDREHEPALHADWFWYMAQEDPVRLPYGFVQVRRGHHWILARRVIPADEL